MKYLLISTLIVLSSNAFSDCTSVMRDADNWAISTDQDPDSPMQVYKQFKQEISNSNNQNLPSIVRRYDQKRRQLEVQWTYSNFIEGTGQKLLTDANKQCPAEEAQMVQTKIKSKYNNHRDILVALTRKLKSMQ